MTDKPIMIDGIDVSGCEFYNTDDKTCREVNGKYDTDICEFDKCENSNCYFKQLTRKTRECEELKSHVLTRCYECNSEYLSPVEVELYDENKQLKDENEKFKNFVAHNLFDINCDNWLDRFIDYFEKWKHELVAENEKLKKANDKKNELLAKLGCPTTATAKKKAYCLQQQLDQLKAENEELKQKNSILEDEFKILEDNLDSRTRDFENIIEQAEQKLEKIEKIAKDFHYAIIPFHRGVNHEFADRIDYYLNQIL